MSKVDRAKHGPGWGEVILGAVLSLILGVAVGAVLMVLQPVISVKEPPKEPIAGAVYYIQGLPGDANKARVAMGKRKAFVEGQSVKVTEDEINALASAAAAPSAPAAKPGEKAAPAAAKTNETLSTGVPNFRVRDGRMQIAVPVTVNVMGFEQKLVAQARGGFEKSGDVFAFEPNEMYLGSCPIQRLPFLAGYVKAKIATSQKVPDDIAAAWAKLANVSIEGNTLNLAVQ
jgi:hypothetical protein